MAASKSALEQRKSDLDAHFKARREQGLPAHRPQEHKGEAGGVAVETLAGVAYVKVGDTEVELDLTVLGNLISELEAARQAVS